MFSKLKQFVVDRFVLILAVSVVGFNLYSFVDSVTNAPELKDFKGGIQNHLVWSIKGECYFVRPHTTNTTYLIRVQDCDKQERVGK